MKVTIDIPDELIARWEAAEQMEYQAMASGLDADNRQALAEAYQEQAAVFREFRPLLAMTPLWAAASRASKYTLAEAREWADRAEQLRAHEAGADR